MVEALLMILKPLVAAVLTWAFFRAIAPRQ